MSRSRRGAALYERHGAGNCYGDGPRRVRAAPARPRRRGSQRVLKVRVLAVSDEVDEALCQDMAPARGVDVVLACGDLPFEYLEHLMNALDVPLVFVPGNHDPDLGGYRQGRGGLM